MERIVEGSPHPNARTIGVVYLLYFLAAFFEISVGNLCHLNPSAANDGR